MSTTQQFDWVHESCFGKWFLNTKTWVTRVLQIALHDLVTLMDESQTHPDTILDIGVGFGKSLWNLEQQFKPKKLIGLDVDKAILIDAQQQAAKCQAEVEFVHSDASSIPLPDNHVDMIFCHQTFHHIIDQEQAISEFFRVLKPGGVLLFAESTKEYIHSWIIRWLFRHPMDVQKTAQEYLALIKQAGFTFSDKNISYPYLWWSRSDLGLMERLFRQPIPANKEETLLNLVATKPIN